MLAAGCAKEYDDSDIWGKISDLDTRLIKVEQAVKILNETTVPGIQTIINALIAKDPVTNVTLTDDGYLITFYSGTTAVVPIPKEEQPDEPILGVKLVDGSYCWTINGVIIKDAAGKAVPVSGAAPSFRVNDGKYEYSLDGQSWIPIPEAAASAPVVSVEQTDESVIVAYGGTVIVLTKDVPFSLSFTFPQDLSIMKGETAYVGYTLNGVKADDITEVGILTTTAGFEAEAEPYAGQNDAGVISITNNSEIANATHKVYVFAANGKGKTDIKGLSFSSTTLKAVLNVQMAAAAGSSDILLDVKADEDYDISISADAPWIHVTPPTRALYNDKLAVTVDENTSNAYRGGTISLLSKVDGSVLDEIDLLQAPVATEATSIASVEIIPDGTALTLYSISTVAASDKKAIVTDGISQMYVIANGLYAEGVFDLTGVKKTDKNGLSYLDVKSLNMKMDAQPIILDKHDAFKTYYVLENDYNYVFTVINGSLSKSGSAYIVKDKEETVNLVLEDAPAELGLAAMVGKDVAVKAWVISTEGVGNVAYADAIAVEARELAFAQEAQWSVEFDGDSEISITSALANDHYLFGCFSEEEFLENYQSEEGFFAEYPYLLADNLYYEIFYYGLYGYDFDFVYSNITYSGSQKKTFDLSYGKHYVYVIGFDDDGALSGQYALKLIDKPDPHVPATYEEFIGQWQVGGKIWTISAKESGSTYSIDGVCFGDYAELQASANFIDGKLVLPEQAYDISASTRYGEVSPVMLCGQFVDYYIYCGYGEMDDEPGVIMTIGKLPDGSYDIVAGSSPGGKAEGMDSKFTYYGFGGKFSTGNYIGESYALDYQSMPSSFAPFVPDPDLPVVFEEDFENESSIASWTFIDADGDGHIWDYSAEFKSHSGDGVIFSQSYDNSVGALTPDNWAFTPEIRFTSDNYLSFWIIGQDASYFLEHFAAYIIGAAPSAENLSSAVKLYEGDSAGDYTRVVVKIPDDFANKTGYIGIRHFDCTDMFYMNLDDVKVTEGNPVAGAVSAPSFSAPAKPQSVSSGSNTTLKWIEKGAPLTKYGASTAKAHKRSFSSTTFRNR